LLLGHEASDKSLVCVWVGLVAGCVHNNINMLLFYPAVKFFFKFFSMRKSLIDKHLRAGGPRKSLKRIGLQ
jgi:hypothetical protein